MQTVERFNGVSFKCPLCFIALLVLAISGCATGPSGNVQRDGVTAPFGRDQERDEIFSLAAYKVAVKDWQSESNSGRGYNIAAVLVSPEGRIVYAARNANRRTKNSTQHAEVRLMQGFLAMQAKQRTNSQSHLEGFSIYTTLEPCAQCAGMMTLLKVRRTVYGQTDPDFGNAFERLQFDSSKHGGFRPYPRPVESVKSSTSIRKSLDEAFAGTRIPITDFLATDVARRLFEKAGDELAALRPKNAQIAEVISQAREFLDALPDREPVLELKL